MDSLWFSTHRGTLYCLSSLSPYLFFFTHALHSFFFLFFFFARFTLLLSPPLPPKIWLQERLWLLHPPIVPLNTYLSRHLKDYRLRDVLDFEAYMELIGCLKETNIQWVVEWWHISSMVHSCCKDHYVTLVGLHCCFFYSTFCISRKFGER